MISDILLMPDCRGVHLADAKLLVECWAEEIQAKREGGVGGGANGVCSGLCKGQAMICA